MFKINSAKESKRERESRIVEMDDNCHNLYCSSQDDGTQSVRKKRILLVMKVNRVAQRIGIKYFNSASVKIYDYN